MRYLALACDYDGTLATHGSVDSNTLTALERVVASGRKLILVTGRELPDLERAFPHLELFDRVVAENGALLYRPGSHEQQPLCEGASPQLVRRLEGRHVQPLSIGRCINAFLSLCECSVAVANALASLKQRADVVTGAERGAGVRELVAQLTDDDLAGWKSRLDRHAILLGHDEKCRPVSLRPYGDTILVAGPSGSGKSTVVTAFLERLVARRYQLCLIDPEGDFEGLPETVCVGDEQHPPSMDEVAQLLERFESTVVNLLGVPLADRPAVFTAALSVIQGLRARTGRPHWLVMDEAHHLLPESWRPAPVTLPQVLESAVLITVHPDHVSPAALAAVDAVLAVGPEPWKTIHAFCSATREPPPAIGQHLPLEKLEVLVWFRRSGKPPVRVRVEPGSAERRRHRRKYAHGDIQDKSFYFRGPDGTLNLRAQNLAMFVQIGEGVDDRTWMHHLRQGDYSRWVRDAIKDETLAEEIRRIESQDLPPQQSRAQIKNAIEQKYTSAA